MKENAHDKLISLFRQGNMRAFTAVFDLCYPSVFYFAKSFVNSSQEAEDITMDAFMKLWKRHSNFENIDKIRSFLNTTAKNSCLDYLRHLKITTLKQEEIVKAGLDDKEMITDRLLTTGELLGNIHAAIEKLPKKRRLIFKMAYIDELKNEEIAQRLNINEKTVRNQKVRAIKQLRFILLK